MGFCGLLDDRQPEPRAGLPAGAVGPVEAGEDVRQVMLGEALAVVENDDLDRALEELTGLVRGLLAPAGIMSRP